MNNKNTMKILIILDMVFGVLKKFNDHFRRRVQRALLVDPDKMPQRYAIIMASVLLISIVVTYNVLYEREKKKEG
jgi:hypothetical protein